MGLTQNFKSFDKNNDGVLSMEELYCGLKKVNIDEDRIGSLIDAMDLNHDGKVNYNEFMAALVELQGKQKQDMVAEAFRVFDTNGDGSISYDELVNLFGATGPLASVLPDGKTVHEVLEEIDSSGDGAISLEEFNSYLEEEKEKIATSTSSQDGATRVFGNLDVGTVGRRSSLASNDGGAMGRRRTSVLFDFLSNGKGSEKVGERMGRKSSLRVKVDPSTTEATEEDSPVSGEEPLHSIFARLAAQLASRTSSGSSSAAGEARDYDTLCANHADRLSEKHWLMTVGDLLELHDTDWPLLELPLKLQNMLKASIGIR